MLHVDKLQLVWY